MTERLHFHFSLSCIGEGNGNPLKCSCLENPRDGGAWWAAVYGIAQSRTRLKWLSNSRPFSLQGYNIASLTSIHIYCHSLQVQAPNCRLNNLSRETNVITSVIPPSSPPYVLVTQCVWLFVTPWTVACQAPLSMGLSRQEYWSGLPFLSPGHLPDTGIKPGTPWLRVVSLPSEPPGKPHPITCFKNPSWGLSALNQKNKHLQVLVTSPGSTRYIPFLNSYTPSNRILSALWCSPILPTIRHLGRLQLLSAIFPFLVTPLADSDVFVCYCSIETRLDFCCVTDYDKHTGINNSGIFLIWRLGSEVSTLSQRFWMVRITVEDPLERYNRSLN